jgi:hypothetical protein
MSKPVAGEIKCALEAAKALVTKNPADASKTATVTLVS